MLGDDTRFSSVHCPTLLVREPASPIRILPERDAFGNHPITDSQPEFLDSQPHVETVVRSLSRKDDSAEAEKEEIRQALRGLSEDSED